MLKPDEKQRAELAERLKQVIADSKLRKSDLARACNVSPQALTGWLKTGRIAKNSLAIIAKETKVDLNWLITGDKKGGIESNVEAAPPLGGMAPLISWIQAGAFAESVIELNEDTEYYPRPANASDQTFVLRVVGESMIDEYKPGTLIFVDPERAAISGDDVIAAMEDSGEATFKRYIEDPGMGKMLKALNSTWPNQFVPINGNCRIVGVVVADMRLR